MQMITKGFVWLSCLLIVAGIILTRVAWPYIGVWIYAIRDLKYGVFFLILGVGLVLAVLNIFECKYLWARVFKRPGLDLLGISAGVMIGLIIGYIY